MNDTEAAAAAADQQPVAGAAAVAPRCAAAAAPAAATPTPDPSPPPLHLLQLPRDVWSCLTRMLDPRDVCRLAAVCRALRTEVLAQQRRAVLLARMAARVQARRVRASLSARAAFVCPLIGQDQLPDRQASWHGIADALQRSPDPLPDLAAALQLGLTLLTVDNTARRPAAHVLAPLRADLVRCVNYVCLLSWRQHMRASMRRHHHQPEPEQQQQQQLEQQPAARSAEVQTELGPSLSELEELKAGLATLMSGAAGRPATGAASATLLHHLLLKQLAAWNLPAGGAQGGGEGGGDD